VARSTGRGVDDNFVFAAAGAINAIARAQVVERAVMAVAGPLLGSLFELEDLGPKDLKGIARACRSRRRDRGPVRGS
jgi:hypothetical protein